MSVNITRLHAGSDLVVLQYLAKNCYIQEGRWYILALQLDIMCVPPISCCIILGFAE